MNKDLHQVLLESRVEPGISMKENDLIRTIDIYIPYAKIRINCITEEVRPLNIFFETILSLCDIGYRRYSDIARIMGIEVPLLNEVVVDMASIDYVQITAHEIVVTKKGKEVLLSKKSVARQKEVLGPYFLNMITEEIEDADDFSFTKLSKNSLYISPRCEASIEYLNNKISDFDNFYQEEQGEGTTEKRAIKKILSKENEAILYRKILLNIYYNNEGNYEFYIPLDKKGFYVDRIFEDVMEFRGVLNSIFNNDRKYCTKIEEIVIEEIEYPDFSEQIFGADEKESMLAIGLDRMQLFPHEYQVFLNHFSFIEFQYLVVRVSNSGRFLIESIQDILCIAETKEVHIYYETDTDYVVKNYIVDRINRTRNKNIQIFPTSNIKGNEIEFYPFCKFNLKEKTANIDDKKLIYIDGHVTFLDSGSIREDSIEQGGGK